VKKKKCSLEPNKKSFDNKTQAQNFAYWFYQRHQETGLLHEYSCLGCGKWHLTKREQLRDAIVLQPFRCSVCGKVPDDDWIYTKTNLYCSACAKFELTTEKETNDDK
jgi:hypothetical protein